MRKHLLVALILLLSFPLEAQETCTDFEVSDLEYASVAKITGRSGTRAYFYGDNDSCMTNNRCRKPQFIIPNEYVIVTSPLDHSACALYVNGRTGVQTKGWLKGSVLGYNLAPALATWTGTWRNDNGNTITLRVRNGQVSATGAATFRRNTGEFNGTAAVADGILNIESGDCTVRMANLGRQLYVVDNSGCGGLNVSFTGSYKKQP